MFTKTDRTELQNQVDKVLGKDRILVEDSDEDRLCWRCGQPESEHRWYGGRTYCESAWMEDDLPDVFFDDTKRFEPNPPQMDNEELVRRFQFLRDTWEWMR